MHSQYLVMMKRTVIGLIRVENWRFLISRPHFRQYWSFGDCWLGYASSKNVAFTTWIMTQTKPLMKKCAALAMAGCWLSVALSLSWTAAAPVRRQIEACVTSLPGLDLLTPVPPRGLYMVATLSHFDYASLTLTVLFDQGWCVCALSPLKSYFSAQIWISL